MKVALIRKSRLNIWVPVIIVVAIIATYLPALDGEFQWDDHNNIRENKALRQGPKEAIFFWPTRALTALTFQINYRWGGMSVRGFHLTNVAIHILGAIFFYFILRRLFPGKRHYLVVVLGSLFFALHPIQTQSVSYIVQRYCSLSGALALGSVYFYLEAKRQLRGQSSGSNRLKCLWFLLLGLGLYLGALAARESAMIVPWIIVLIERIRPSRSRNYSLILPFLLLSLLVFLPIFLMAGGEAGMDNFYYQSAISNSSQPLKFGGQGVEISGRGQYFLTQLNAVRDYIRLIIFPWGQAALHDYPVARPWSLAPIVSGLLVISLLLGGGAWLRQGKAGGAGIIWFLGCLVPTSTVVILWPFLSEHHLYLSLAGAGVVFSALIKSSHQRLGYYLGFAIVLLLAGGTFLRNHAWQTEVKLWQKNIKRYPACGLAHYNYSGALIRAGFPQTALEETKLAQKLNPRLNTWPNQWSALYRLGLYQQAREAAAIWTKGEPDSLRAYLSLAQTLIKLQKDSEAAQALDKARNLAPNQAEPLLLQALLARRAGKIKVEESYLKTALDHDPQNESGLTNLASLRMRQGQIQEARKLYDLAVSFHPQSPLTWYNRANFYQFIGEKDAGAKDLFRARQLARGTFWENKID